MKFKKGDLLLLVIIIVSIFMYFGWGYLWKDVNEKEIIIEVKGKVYKTISMNKLKKAEDIHIDLGEGKYIEIHAQSDGVYVTDVVCPDLICKKTGTISKVGQNIVCLPNQVVIYISGQKQDSDIDQVTY